MTDIISAIDAATGCQHCGNPLGSSPSSDFCSEFCQRSWQAKRVGLVAVDPLEIRLHTVQPSIEPAAAPTAYTSGSVHLSPAGYSESSVTVRAYFERHLGRPAEGL